MAEPSPLVTDGTGPGNDRVILHVDMDAFFASVEVLDDPTLAGRPVIVGGSGGRGVVAACTYEARRFGVHSAMPSSVARRLCPGAVFLDGRYHRYQEVSTQLGGILEEVTPLVEAVSLDEAYLDVTGARQLFGDGPTIARTIRGRVFEELGLACSVGVGRTKLVAKLASKAAKPVAARSGVTPGPGVVVVPACSELDFLLPLPVRALAGVGPATGRRLASLGVVSVGDVAALPTGALERYFGRAAGAHLAALARGEDPRPVVADRAAKSIGHEETFSTDIWDAAELHRHLARMVDAATTGLRQAGRGARTVQLKLRFGDFTTLTRSHSLSAPIESAAAVGAVAGALLDSVERDRGVRLLGVSLAGLGRPAGTGGPGGPGEAATGVQMSFDLDHRRDASHEGPVALADVGRIEESWAAVTAAIDAIRARYGGSSVGPASLVGAHGLRVRNRGDAQWGPSAREPTDHPGAPVADDGPPVSL